MVRTFKIAPCGPGPAILMAATASLLVVALSAMVADGSMPTQIVLAIGLLFLGIGVFIGRVVLSAYWVRFELTPAELNVLGEWLWAESVPRSTLCVDDARVVDLEAEPRLLPTSRNGGTGLPGYLAGWFSHGDGRNSLLYVTNRRRVVIVPTNSGDTLMVSPADPEGFLVALQGRNTPVT